nr:immunoglobulin heavy chain junction region [Mus musculus]
CARNPLFDGYYLGYFDVW